MESEDVRILRVPERARTILWRLTENTNGGFPIPHLEWRYADQREGEWVSQPQPRFRTLAAFAAELQARVKELEEACEDYQLRICEVERHLNREQRERITCPCGGGPDHPADWCSDYTQGMEGLDP